MSALAQNAQPMEILKGAIEQIMDILEDPRYKDAAQKEAQREKIWEVIQKHFDSTEMAKRALARNWRKFTPQERKKFAEVFAELLRNTYLEKIQGEYKSEKVIYLGQEKITDTKAVVKTKVFREKIEIPVDYSLQMRSEIWKVYDVNIEGVSLVKNYRTQFRKILLKETPAQLIDRLKEKVAKQQEHKATVN